MPTDFSSLSRRPVNPWINLHSPTPCQWNRVELPIRDLPSALIGLRLIHISDPHFRAVWSEGWSSIIRQINAAQADLILMTGDFVDSKTNAGPALRCVKRFFSSLQCRLGKYAIFGNHDHDLLYRIAQQAAEQGLIFPEPWPRRRADADHEPTGTPIPPRLPALSFFGHQLLDDRRELLTYQGASIELIGLRGTSRADFNYEFLQSLPLKPSASVRIILSHHPDSIRHLQSLNADIILSGHTHGGQICLPGPRAIISHDTLPKSQASGIHRFGDSWLVISRGLGFSSLPIRLFCPPEITELTLINA
jgi:predicted MPP superfamily phosphohydrolase